jgi:hypothetical protein
MRRAPPLGSNSRWRREGKIPLAPIIFSVGLSLTSPAEHAVV